MLVPSLGGGDNPKPITAEEWELKAMKSQSALKGGKTELMLEVERTEQQRQAREKGVEVIRNKKNGSKRAQRDGGDNKTYLELEPEEKPYKNNDQGDGIELTYSELESEQGDGDYDDKKGL
jgi:hypothetical protein